GCTLASGDDREESDVTLTTRCAMTSQDRQGFVLCLVAAVLVVVILITGYVQLKPSEITYSDAARNDLTQLIKAFH
ncbi:MAG TPA: hypothetical protein VJJ20_01160, partial [Candidatus Paceibacterota bacterium]